MRRRLPFLALVILVPGTCATSGGAGKMDGAVGAEEHEAAGLSYVEVVTGTDDRDARLPLVVALHGRGDRPRVPEGAYYGVRQPLRLVLPRAPEPLGDGYTWLPVSVTEGDTEALARSLADASDRLAAFLAEVRARHPTRGGPIVTGFSQGGMLAFALAVRHPGSIGCALPVAGWLPPSWIGNAPPHAPAIRAMHGLDDPIVPVGPTRDAVRVLAAHGWDVDLREVPHAAHATTASMNRQLHHWLTDAVEASAR